MIPYEDLSYIKANTHQNIEVSKEELNEQGSFVSFLADAGFDYMLPDDMATKYESEYEDSFDDETEENSHDPEWSKYKRPDYIDWLKQIFNADYMETDEFLQTPPWVFLNMTAAQFHMIDSSVFDQDSFIRFVEHITDEHLIELFPSIEIRIRFCTLYACAPERVYRETDDELLYIGNKLAGKEFNQAVTLLQFLRDYRSNLGDARGLASFCERKDLEMPHEPFDYPDFPKPSALKDWHDKAMRDARLYHTYIDMENEQELNEGIAATVSHPNYKQFLYQEDGYSVMPVTCNQDLIDEGEFLGSCVGDYGSSLADGTSYIYFIRTKDNPDTPFYTAEIKPDAAHLSYSLTQLFTFDNTTEKSGRFRQFIRNWCKKKRLFIKCVV